ncbi:SDR family NAD(P)-dependent oxidoreductase [Actinophytocola oryzae]|uniref:3-oxoacyl-[acyl-carrier protein] reductase n=1 Tax=Actinophytocola oryzae TaxID=502181 RepID=A0A4R7W2V7_9PSEU|nr:SDR family oxidoreductase [Actinophytocola oryzae]TDV56219.1 3-oxoacyl-[acyl-carrier protein] reductase [Actinophytocola oryzae]
MPDRTRLDGRVALVTGGSRGVGRAVVRRLAELGAEVAFCYRRDVGAAEELVAELDGRASAYAADLATPGAAAEFVAAASADLGAPTVLVHNAGIASSGRSVEHTTQEEYLRLYQVHALAGAEACTAALPGMRTAGGGSIVFVSSVVARGLGAGLAPYAMAKAAVEALASVLSFEERTNGIRVNVVAPGLVSTEMGDRLVRAGSASSAAESLDAHYPFGRVCRPEDVADVVGYLAGDTSSYLTRQTVVVNGGGNPDTLVHEG